MTEFLKNLSMDERVESILLNVHDSEAGLCRIATLRNMSVLEMITELNYINRMYHHQLGLRSQELKVIRSERAAQKEPPVQPHPLAIARPLLHPIVHKTLR